MRVDVGGLSLNVVVEGEGPVVLLLHGWPDSSRLWRHQVPALAGAGFRVVAPDLRGFGESDRPEGTEHYALSSLLGDALGVLDHLGVERAHVVGHDWGAALAWLLASFSPQRVERLVALSVGHPAAFRAAGLAQREKSWYMLLFQFAGVAEKWLRKDDWGNFREFAAGHRDLDACVDDLSRPGALTASLGLYRANATPERLVADPVPFPPVAAPALGVWSTGDRYLTEAVMVASAAHVAGPWRYERLDDASHWMQLDQPDRLNELLVGHLVDA